jgi:hypothetical protein
MRLNGWATWWRPAPLLFTADLFKKMQAEREGRQPQRKKLF